MIEAVKYIWILKENKQLFICKAIVVNFGIKKTPTDLILSQFIYQYN